MDEYAAVLVEAANEAIPQFVERCVVQTYEVRNSKPPDEVIEAARSAGQQARDDLMPQLHELLERDIDEQGQTPLQILRFAVAYPTEVLKSAQVPFAEREEYLRNQFPDDVYDLTPANFADVGPSLAEPGMMWGAAKAFAHKQRHKN